MVSNEGKIGRFSVVVIRANKDGLIIRRTATAKAKGDVVMTIVQDGVTSWDGNRRTITYGKASIRVTQEKSEVVYFDTMDDHLACLKQARDILMMWDQELAGKSVTTEVE